MKIQVLLSSLAFASLINAAPKAHISKRTYPEFVDWPDDAKSKNHKEKLTDALPEAIDLVTRVTENYESYKDIWSKYFAESDHDTVKKVYKQIVSDPSKPGHGEPRLENCKIIGTDLSHGHPSPRDSCAEGYEAYTVEVAPGYDDPAGTTLTYFCDAAYAGPDSYKNMKCVDIGDTLSEKMEFLGATILHEWTHNDNIGKEVIGSHITDVGGMGSYGPWQTRNMLKHNPDSSKINADSYTWLALEVFWTKLCLKDKRFKDPVKPSTVQCHHASDPSGNMGVCLNLGATGWCDCGSAGNFPVIEGEDPCGYTNKPETEPMDIYATDCGPTQEAPSSPECGHYTAPIADVKDINSQLNKLTDESVCCSSGKGDCVNVASSGDVAVDLCSDEKTPLCVSCARLGNYVAGLIDKCEKDGKIGGKQDIAETPGLNVQI